MRNLAQYLAKAEPRGKHVLCEDNGCAYTGACSHNFESGPPQSAVWFSCGPQFKNSTTTILRKAAHEKNADMKVVHIVRDPVGLIMSGYLYHMHTDDHLPDQRMRQASIKEGLEIEARWAMRETLLEMLNIYESSQNDPNVLTVHLEDFIKGSNDFDKTVA